MNTKIQWDDLFFRSTAYHFVDKQDYYLEIVYPYANGSVHHAGRVFVDRICIYNHVYEDMSLEEIKEQLWADCVRYQINYWIKLQKEIENVDYELGEEPTKIT